MFHVLDVCSLVLITNINNIGGSGTYLSGPPPTYTSTSCLWLILFCASLVGTPPQPQTVRIFNVVTFYHTGI